MIVGLDVGYGYVKAVTVGKDALFPSVAGSATLSQFGISGSSNMYLDVSGKTYAIGDTAVKFSRFESRQESRNWIMSNEWLALAYAALIKVDVVSPVTLVVGLPLSYYSDRKKVEERLLGKHEIASYDNGSSSRAYVEIRKVYVVPQPFGALFKQVFLPNGQVREKYLDLLTGRVGIIDIGSNHTNLLEVYAGDMVKAGSDAINMGGWDLCRAVRDHLLASSPGAELKDHELARAIEEGKMIYFGADLPLEPIVAPIREDLISTITATATTLWGDASNFNAILISGGMAPVAGEAIKSFFSRHERVIVVDDAQMANARGFFAFGRFKQS